MGKYWKKLNTKIGWFVKLRADIAGKKNEDFIESAILQASLVEAALRMAITNKVGSRKKSFKKYWDGDARFEQLINYFELSGGQKKLIERLRIYNNTRNRIVHHTMRTLVKEAKKNYLLGKRLENKLYKEAGLK